MSARLQNAAETLKLGRLIGLSAEDLAFLEAVPANELRALRESVTDSLFDAVGSTLDRLAIASRLLPAPLVATIAERYFGPLLCARAAAAIEPARAIDLASRLSPVFLADATVELDPRRVAEIIGGVPASLASPVARELGRREEHVTMGRFLAFVSDDAVVACMGALTDEAMLRTAFVLEHKEALDHAVTLLPPDRIPGVLRFASEQDLWPEALDLLDHLSVETRGPIADVVATLDEHLVQRLVDAVQERQLWESLLPVVATMSPDARALIASRSAFHAPEVLAEIIDVAAHARMWEDLLPLIGALPERALAIAAQLLTEQPGEAVAGLVEDAQALALWPTLLPVVDVMDHGAQQALASNAAFHEPDVMRGIIVAAAASGLWRALLPLLGRLPADVRVSAAHIIAGLDPSVMTTSIQQAVAEPEALLPLMEVIAAIEPSERAEVLAIFADLTPEVATELLLAAQSPQLRPLLLDKAHQDIAVALDALAHRLDLPSPSSTH